MNRREFLGVLAAAASSGLPAQGLAAPTDLRSAAREAWIYCLPLIETARVRAHVRRVCAERARRRRHQCVHSLSRSGDARRAPGDFAERGHALFARLCRSGERTGDGHSSRDRQAILLASSHGHVHQQFRGHRHADDRRRRRRVRARWTARRCSRRRDPGAHAVDLGSCPHRRERTGGNGDRSQDSRRDRAQGQSGATAGRVRAEAIRVGRIFFKRVGASRGEPAACGRRGGDRAHRAARSWPLAELRSRQVHRR